MNNCEIYALWLKRDIHEWVESGAFTLYCEGIKERTSIDIDTGDWQGALIKRFHQKPMYKVVLNKGNEKQRIKSDNLKGIVANLDAMTENFIRIAGERQREHFKNKFSNE